jgi:hypothetical protein
LQTRIVTSQGRVTIDTGTVATQHSLLRLG